MEEINSIAQKILEGIDECKRKIHQIEQENDKQQRQINELVNLIYNLDRIETEEETETFNQRLERKILEQLFYNLRI